MKKCARRTSAQCFTKDEGELKRAPKAKNPNCANVHVGALYLLLRFLHFSSGISCSVLPPSSAAAKHYVMYKS